MHGHDHSVPASTPWLLVCGLLVCVGISVARLVSARTTADSDSFEPDSDGAHIAMNSVMAAMALDSTMTSGRWWLSITVVLAVVLVARSLRSRSIPAKVTAFWAVFMVVATYLMSVGETGGAIAWALASVVVLDLVGTSVLVLTRRSVRVPAFAPDPGTEGTDLFAGPRWAAIPHVGMGIGMIVMLLGG